MAFTLRVQVRVFTGTAGVSPASSIKFTQVTAESVNWDYVAFNEGGRDARGPSSYPASSTSVKLSSANDARIVSFAGGEGHSLSCRPSE